MILTINTILFFLSRHKIIGKEVSIEIAVIRVFIMFGIFCALKLISNKVMSSSKKGKLKPFQEIIILLTDFRKTVYFKVIITIKIIIWTLFIIHKINIIHNQTTKPVIISSFSIGADIVKTIAGDEFKVKSIIPNNIDIHSYELKMSDIQKTKGKVVFINGLDLESKPLVDTIKKHAKKVIILSSNQVRYFEYEKGVSDPHAWLDPENVISYAYNIYVTLSHLYPEQEPIFYINFIQYKNKLEILAARMKKELPGKSYIITKDDFNRYVGLKYGVRIIHAYSEFKKEPSLHETYTRIQKAIHKEFLTMIPVYGEDNNILNQFKVEMKNPDVNIKKNQLYSDGLIDEDEDKSAKDILMSIDSDLYSVGGVKNKLLLTLWYNFLLLRG